jgi:hypothetical protein
LFQCRRQPHTALYRVSTVATVNCSYVLLELAEFIYMVGYQSVDILKELRGITRNDEELLEVQSGIKR